MVFEETNKGLILKVRLTPNAAAAGVKGLFKNADGEEYVKIAVTAVPEKNQANKDLVALIAKALDMPKTAVEIFSGATDRYKKVLLSGQREVIKEKVQLWLEKVLVDA